MVDGRVGGTATRERERLNTFVIQLGMDKAWMGPGGGERPAGRPTSSCREDASATVARESPDGGLGPEERPARTTEPRPGRTGRSSRGARSAGRAEAAVGYHRAMGLTRDDVAHVAHLARLGLTEAELGRLEGQLNHILDQYAKLAELDTDAIAPTAQTIELENILREDVVRPRSPRPRRLANAPDREGDFIVVPAILGE